MHRGLARGERIVLASHNAVKLREIAALLGPHGVAVVSAAALGLPEPAETEDSFLGNARLKALAAATAAGLPALADDSGFCVAALDGAPGVHTADWATRPDGTRDYALGMAEVARRAEGAVDRRAWFVSVLALAWPDGAVEAFAGRVDGEWVWPPRGAHGFGYDPMFVPRGSTLTFGEMQPAEKEAVNHRARAFAQLAVRCLAPPEPLG
jgi:XTP/dITP diphosphohydrolase